MGMKEDIMKAKNDVREIKEEFSNESFARELLKDQRKQNKRLFIIVIVILSMWFATIGYLVYILNDIGTTTTKQEYNQEINDLDNIDSSTITNGGN